MLAAALAVTALAQAPQVVPPKPISRTDPEYPEEARRASVNGNVAVLLTIAENGMAEDIEIERGAGFGLDEAAINAVRGWRFEPATKGGAIVRYRTRMEIGFKLLTRDEGQITRLAFDLPPAAERPILIRGIVPPTPREPVDTKLRVSLTVAPDGVPRDVSLIDGAPGRWAEDAVPQIREWRFDPARLKGKAIEVKGILEVTRTAPPAAK